MKRMIATVSTLALIAAALMLGGCESDGLEYNGVRQLEQYKIRRVPIVHYLLPSEMINNVTLLPEVNEPTMINLTVNSFQELANPGNDLWQMSMTSTPCTDNPSPLCGVPDWPWTFEGGDSANGPAWKTNFMDFYTLSFQNQWFLRGVNGAALTPTVPGTAAITYEGYGYNSMAISVIEAANGVTGTSTLTVPAAREVGDPTTFDALNVPRIAAPASNLLWFQYVANPGGNAPAGLLACAWQEAPQENKRIEDSRNTGSLVPVPDYFGGGSGISARMGVYIHRYREQWDTATGKFTTGSTPLISPDNTLMSAYFLAVTGNHCIGYGLGLLDSSFAIPGVSSNNEESIMNQSTVLDMSAFIASGKRFQFVTEDLLRMQDVENGDFMTPGANSTLPGVGR